MIDLHSMVRAYTVKWVYAHHGECTALQAGSGAVNKQHNAAKVRLPHDAGCYVSKVSFTK